MLKEFFAKTKRTYPAQVITPMIVVASRLGPSRLVDGVYDVVL